MPHSSLLIKHNTFLSKKKKEIDGNKLCPDNLTIDFITHDPVLILDEKL